MVPNRILRMDGSAKQRQFLQVVSRDEAERRLHAAFPPIAAFSGSASSKSGGSGVVASEAVRIDRALRRVLAADVAAPVDVPGFARSNMDGFAVRAVSTFGASEEHPADLLLLPDPAVIGVLSSVEIAEGEAVSIATGAPIPRGADAVVMIEDTDADDGRVQIRRAVPPGGNIAGAGSDMARGEIVMRHGTRLGSRDTGVLAALGIAEVAVVRRPRVLLYSTGDELVPPGEPLIPGQVFDCNGRVLADALHEVGAEVTEGGIVRDDAESLARRLNDAVAKFDMVIFSGGTSKGAGDICHQVLAEHGDMLFHGVALKPGKPIALARVGDTPVVLLPGFPTSAVFTFHELVAPWLRARGGLPPEDRRRKTARLARPMRSQRGRREYDLVHLLPVDDGLLAWPLGKGSGSITTFSRADGFHAVPEDVELLDVGAEVDVTLLGPLRLADLAIIGSHCTGLDLLISRAGLSARLIAAGSQAGVEAARLGQCDIAGVHLLDEKTNRYNEAFVPEGVDLIPGYTRRQGIVRRAGEEAVGAPKVRLVNRNRGAGTRVLIDRLLDGDRPAGYEFEVRSHQATAAAVASGAADWGVCIEGVARTAGLEFEFLAEERFDFMVPHSRRDRPAVRAFLTQLSDSDTIEALANEGLRT
jgi:putative molybdopterin biosynthesis protein